MKYRYLTVIISFLYCAILFNSKLVRSQSVISLQTGTLVGDEFDRFTRYSNKTFCSYSFDIWAIQLVGDGYVNVTVDGGISELMSSNATHFLYKISYTSYISTIDDRIRVNVLGTGYSNYSIFPITCSQLDINSIDVQVEKLYYDWYLHHLVYLKISGVPSYVQVEGLCLNSLVQPILIEQGHYITLVNLASLNSVSITAPFEIELYFGSQVITKTINGYFNSSFNDPNLKINYYPLDFGKPIQLSGKTLYPLMTIETITPTQPQDPYFTFSSNYGPYFGPTAPIYEDNGRTTYIVSPYMTFYLQTQLSLYIQNKTNSYQVLNTVLDITDVDISTIALSDITNMVQTDNLPLLNLQIPSQNTGVYKLNFFGFIINSFKIEIGAPFGFIGPSNSNYEYKISIPLNKRLKTAKLSVTSDQFNTLDIPIPENTNEPDYTKAPIIESYSFIYLRNYLYIFNVSINDNGGCGAGFISLDGVNKLRLSQFRVSGVASVSVYEIPIDFNLDLLFSKVSIYDYCGNFNTYQNDLPPYVNFEPFVVPFLNYKYALQSRITDISYLYNNLDVRNQSVSNSLYFSCANASIITPFTFRLPVVNQVSITGYFTKEYFGFWNSTINKFQIDFIVPKNSRLGPFLYSIGNVNSNSVPSNFFPSSSQLIISRSNFDGIGPIFSRVDRVPFSSGKFGWRLTISDPINGFDNGTITVMGSEDNSIYKFNLLPIDAISGDSKEGVYEILIDLGSNYCINQDYIITFVKLWDTGAQYTVFEYSHPTMNHITTQINNPLYLFSGISNINRYSINQCIATIPDTTEPLLKTLEAFSSSVDVDSTHRFISFKFEVNDPESGININAQGPIIYITSVNFDMVQCISTFQSNTTQFNAFYTCTAELPVGFAFSTEISSTAYISIYGILNSHGLYKGYSSQMLKELSIISNVVYKFEITYSETGAPILLSSGVASSRGGEYFVYGRGLANVDALTIIDAINGSVINTFENIKVYHNSVVLLSDLPPIRNDFFVLVSSYAVNSNRLLVSPIIFDSYTPSQDSNSSDQEPLPTNAPQQCYGNPICGGPTHGTCNNQTGCVCIYPWRGKSCQDKVSELPKPDPNPNQPSTDIETQNYKSLISLHSLREIDINGKAIKNYLFNNKWVFNQYSDLKSNYQINVTTGTNGYNTTISATLEWFNQTKVITFADQDLEMYANSIKYSIEISNYPFSSSLTYLQLVMSATITSTSSDSCSSKDFGETSSGDNSNYINIQIDNKSLYGRFIKRGIIDEGQVVSLSNERLDSALNAVSKASQTQTYIGITIPQYYKRALIDPDFSILISSNSATSVCKSKGLSGAKIAGIVIGATAFAAVIAISIVYYFKKKNDSQKFKANISNKLKQIN